MDNVYFPFATTTIKLKDKLFIEVYMRIISESSSPRPIDSTTVNITSVDLDHSRIDYLKTNRFKFNVVRARVANKNATAGCVIREIRR